MKTLKILKRTYLIGLLSAGLCLAGLADVSVYGKADAEQKTKPGRNAACPIKAGKCGKCQDTACRQKNGPKRCTRLGLPGMTYRVGKIEMQDVKQAKRVAKAKGQPMVYWVEGQAYTDQKLAQKGLILATEKFVSHLCDSRKCPVSGKACVGGMRFASSVVAEQVAKVGKAAMGKISMSYRVGKKPLCCPEMAADFAKAAKKPVTYEIGKFSTTCSLTARMHLAKAKYQAATDAMHRAAKKQL